MTRVSLFFAVFLLISSPLDALALGKKRTDFPRGFPIDFSCRFSGFKKGFYNCDVQVMIGHYGKHDWTDKWPHYMIMRCDGRDFFSGPITYDPTPSSDGYRLTGMTNPNPDLRLRKLPKSHPSKPHPGDDDDGDHKPVDMPTPDDPDSDDAIDASMHLMGISLQGYCE